MKALVYDGPQTLSYRDVEDPKGDDLLIKVEAVGICGSDMHAYLGHDDRRPAPLILGHEAAGTIVGGDRDGERVTINPLVSCGSCHDCQTGRENLCAKRQIISMPPREGAFAQYVTMPASNLVTVPDSVGLDHAAMAEPLAVSWHSVKLGLAAVHSQAKGQAIVIGGGAIGLAAALALRAMGWTDFVVAEPNDARRAFLAGLGHRTKEDASGEYDLVIDAVGHEATRKVSSAIVRPGGVIVHIGLGDSAPGLDVRRMTLQEVTFIGTYTYSAQDFRDCAAAIFDGRLGPLNWVEKRGLSDGAAAFADLRNGQVAAPKIILSPWE